MMYEFITNVVITGSVIYTTAVVSTYIYESCRDVYYGVKTAIGYWELTDDD